MLKKFINHIHIRLSTTKLLNLHIEDYFPLEKGLFSEFEGTYSSKEENFLFTCLKENVDNVVLNDTSTSLQCRMFINESGAVIFEDEVYFTSKNDEIEEHGRVKNGETFLHPSPMTYIDTYEKGQYSNDVFVFKSFETIVLDGIEIPCLIIKKEFFVGLRFQRVERLYLAQGIGIVKYEEKSFYPDKFTLSYQKVKEAIGYRVMKHKTFGNLLFNPNVNQMSGKAEISPDYFVYIVIHTRENHKVEALKIAETLFVSIRDKEPQIRKQIASELLNENNDTWLDVNEIDKCTFVDQIFISRIRFLGDGNVEMQYSDGGLFGGLFLVADIDQDGCLLQVNIVE